MKALILNSWGRTLCMITLICISVASAPKAISDDDTLHVSKAGLEATLKIVTCDDKNIITVEWKNTNATAAIGVLTLTSKSDRSAILAITITVSANQVKTETCSNVDASYRAVDFTTFNNVQAELTLAN